MWWSSDDGYLTEFARVHRLDRTAVLDVVLTLLTVLKSLPAVEVLIPPPGTAAPHRHDARETDAGLLERIRALLAKAERTDFPAEADEAPADHVPLLALDYVR